MNTDAKLIYEKYAQQIQLEALATADMSVAELTQFLLSIDKPTPVTVEVESTPAMRKTGNPYLDVRKYSVINGVAGGDYETAVQTQEYRAHGGTVYDPVFRSSSLWKGKGRRVSTLLVQHIDTNEYYLCISNPRSGSSRYLRNGTEIPLTDIEPFLQTSAPSPKQLNVGIKETNVIQPRYPLIKNIKRIKIQNMDIRVRD